MQDILFGSTKKHVIKKLAQSQGFCRTGSCFEECAAAIQINW